MTVTHSAEETRREHFTDEAPVAAPLSPEVEWYLESRGIKLPPHVAPLWRTPEPRDNPGAWFDAERVDKALKAMEQLRHTQGKWAGTPLRPDPWQVAYIFAPIFGWVHKDSSGETVRIIRSAWIEVPRKNGKGVTIDEMILTADGWKQFGNLVVGDRVHAEDGSLVRVTYVSPEHHLDCYRVTFSDGRSVVCDSDHLWTVWDRYGHDPELWARDKKKGAWVTIDTPELFENHRCGSRRDTRYSVSADRVVHRPDVDLPIDPYVFGYWLGDGNSRDSRFTVDDADYPSFLRQIERAGYVAGESRRNGPKSVRVNVSVAEIRKGSKDSLITRLRGLGVLENKHVPDLFLLAGDDQRLELLRGLMDSDGCAMRTKTPRCEFSSMSETLADAVLFLARSLGWKATKRTGRAKIDGRDCGTKYRITWTAFSDRSPFALARKTAILGDRPTIAPRSMTATISKVERVDSVPTRCIEVDHPSHQFLVGRGLVPTHNTTIAAGIGLILAFGDGEPGAQVYAAAASKDQAQQAYRPAKLLAEGTPSFKRAGIKAGVKQIMRARDQSFMMAIASVGDLIQGTNPNGAIVDELHVHKSADVIDALESGTGARSQPLVIIITTADGGDDLTVYATRRKEIEDLCKGTISSASKYGVVFGARKDDDPFAEETWAKANPGYPISPTREFMQTEAENAKNSPLQLTRFQRLNLNIRTKTESKFITMDVWDRNAGEISDEREFLGAECYGGIDLASVSDLSAVSWLFPQDDGTFAALWRIWTPEANLERLDKLTNGAASLWVEDGWLETTPGNVTDYDYIETQIVRDVEAFDVMTIGYDPYNANQLVTRLRDKHGVQMVKVRQGFLSLSQPLKQTQRLLLKGTSEEPYLRHGDNPVMRWMTDNLAVEVDAAGNVKPSKKEGMHNGHKIDGWSALVNAMSEAIASGLLDDDDGEMDII